MKTIKEMIDTMLAYERGEKVGVINKYGIWEYIDKPIWNLGIFDYCVKPKPNYVPFETTKEFLEAQREHGVNIKRIEDNVLFCAYVNYYTSHVLLEDNKGNIEKTLLGILYGNYEFLDSTPCGKRLRYDTIRLEAAKSSTFAMKC